MIIRKKYFKLPFSLLSSFLGSLKISLHVADLSFHVFRFKKYVDASLN